MTNQLGKLALAVGIAVGTVAVGSGVHAASHREAPLTALDHKADITDFYAFVSYDDYSKVTFILNVDPLLEPSNGPNYFPFDPELRYRIHIDNNHDALEDVTYEFRFKTEQRLPDVFTGFVGAGSGLVAPANSPAPVPPGTPIVPPAITALDGPGSEGLGLRQTYSVTRYAGSSGKKGRKVLAKGLVAVPSNVGPRTMPNYADLRDQGIYHIGDDVKVFAGTVEDPFWIDLGGAFDSLNLRVGASDLGIPGVLSPTQDADDENNYAADSVSGFNVNAIAIEVPITDATADGDLHGADDPLAVIGAWGTTSRPKVKILSRKPDRDPFLSHKTEQIQRMANPLFNELIIGTGRKDEWSRTHPKNDKRFADFALDPLIARVLNALYDTIKPGVLPVPDAPRLDLLPLVQYLPPVSPPDTPAGPVADLLRLNTGIPPTPADKRSRLGFLTLLDDDPSNDDPAGFPNGRRVSDDATDIVARVAAGVLAGPEFNQSPNNRIGDGVNANDVQYPEVFPYLGLAHSGRGRRHVDPGEAGCLLGICPSD